MAEPTEEKALYVGEGGNCLTDGTPLVPHETIALVSKGEAEHSDLWEPVKKGKAASSNPRNSAPGTKSKRRKPKAAAPPPEPDPPGSADPPPDPPAEAA